MDITLSQALQDTTLFSSKALGLQVESYTQGLVMVTVNHDLHKHINRDFVDLCQYYITTAQYAYNKLEKRTEDEKEVYVLHYYLAEVFKDVLFLHRDVLLALQIANHKLLEDRVTQEAVNHHVAASKKMLLEAMEVFLTKLHIERNQVYKDKKKALKTLKANKHSKNPWQIYSEQFKDILEQIKYIADTDSIFTRTIHQFNKIKEFSLANCGSIIQNATYLKNESSKVIDNLKLVKTPDQLKATLHLTEDLLSKIRENSQEQDEYTEAITLKLKPLSEINMPIATQEGYLFTRKIDFNKTVQRWLDYELVQILIDLWENNASMVSYFKHNLHTLNSSLSLSRTTNSIDLIPSQLEVLETVHNNLEDKVKQQQGFAVELEKRLHTYFFATHIYKEKNFLDVSLQSSFSQITNSNSNVFTQLKSRVEKIIKDFSSKYEEKLSSTPERRLENSSKAITYRMFKEFNASYDTLFLNKTLIGDLFIVSRIEEEKRVETTFTQWQNGFHKSIVLAGDALSGKSTFLEYVSKKYFSKAVIFLEPDTKFVIEGKKFKTTRDLKQALEDIKKEIYNVDPVIIIDNVELWRDDTHTLLTNIRALIHFIETVSNEALIIVSISKQMQKHLDKRLLFSNSFSTVIDISKSKTEEIYKALMLRHGASHKELVDEEEQVLPQKKIEQYILSLCREYDYNMGEVLQAWTYGTTLTDKNNVVYNEKSVPFEDFFTDEEIVILKYLALYRNVNELQLKTFLGQRLEGYYKSGLKRLINAKVLVRGDAGYLQINGVLNYDIHRILKYRGVLT